LPYIVYFENEPTASLPAAQVVVTDQLDPTKVNLSTLSLGAISFGSNVISVPSGLSNYSTSYSLSSTLSVRIQGSLDTGSGLLKWTFTSIDPTTGLPPTDPTVGFLPPDTDGVQGQGAVQFTVMPKSGQATGAQLSNMATVVFDSNASISTPTWSNTLDVDAPTSKVTALPATVLADNTGQAMFTVNWSGSDNGSGIASYTIYVSLDGGAFTPWQAGTTSTSASYTGSIGHTYGFYSVATDAVGNVETSKSSAEAETEVVSATPILTTTALTASPTSLNLGASVKFTAVVAPSTGTGVPTGTVNFVDGTTTLGTGTLDGTGTATYSTSALAAGGHNVTAQYSGDASYSASTSTAVTVTVVSPSYKLSVSPASVTVSSGSSGNSTITVTPSGGFNQQVSFSCSGLPVYATCSFSPATVTPNGSNTALTTTLAINTNVATAALRPLEKPGRQNQTPGEMIWCVLLFGGGWLAGVRRRLRWSSMWSAFLLAIVLGGAALLSGGCGSSGNSHQTPAGTSTVTITGSAGGASQTTTLTLTVQ
jgi:Bacterial Ig-like domain (group 3)